MSYEEKMGELYKIKYERLLAGLYKVNQTVHQTGNDLTRSGEHGKALAYNEISELISDLLWQDILTDDKAVSNNHE